MINTQREDWLDAVLNALPDRHFIIDEHGNIVDSFGNNALSSNPSKSTNQAKPSQRKLSDLVPSVIADELQYNINIAICSGEQTVIKYHLGMQERLQLSISELENLDSIEDQWFEATLKPMQFGQNSAYVLWQERDITQAHLYETELKRLSETDELTGILNRRAFLSGLEALFEAQSETQQNLSCLMIDIDHFKEINDQVGHVSGDEVITQVAHACQRLTRGNDYIGRLGGEEFGVALSNINAIQAFDVAERIRQSIESSPCTVDGHVIHTTVSIGIAELNQEITSVKDLLVQADKAMYYSKQTGRNQVTIYHSNLPDIQVNSGNKVHILKAS